MAKSYSEKLKDPRWQKKRLEVLEAAGWRCEKCGAESRELHVHHHIYIKGCSPWEYSRRDLSALCATCHEATEEQLQNLRKSVARLQPGEIWMLAEIASSIRSIGTSDLYCLLLMVRAVRETHDPLSTDTTMIEHIVHVLEGASEFSRVWRKVRGEVIAQHTSQCESDRIPLDFPSFDPLA